MEINIEWEGGLSPCLMPHTLTLYLYCRCERQQGRPAIEVFQEEVDYLQSLRFTWTKIAAIVVGISRTTLYRRLSEWDLPIDINYSIMSDSELDRLVADAKRVHRNYGEVLLMAHLNSRGVRVQRSKLRASIHRTDPHTTQIRRRETVHRCIYSVEGPNSVWHIDGNHKLIQWKLVVHGGIDGKTRTIVFLSCASNNCAATVLLQFNQAVSTFGLPDRVCTDRGRECGCVAFYVSHTWQCICYYSWLFYTQ